MANRPVRKVSSLQDLADLAGVSRATASRALSDSPLLNAKTKERIRELARTHNYSVNRQARDFRLKRRSVISVIFMLDVHSEQHMSDPFFLEMLGAIADSLSDHDYDLLLAHAPIEDVRELKDSRVLRNADGAIFIGQGEEHEALNELATAGDSPIVVWGGQVENNKYVLVGGDNERGGYQATQHLLELGRRRVAFFGGLKNPNPEIAARYSGYLRALSEAGIEPDPELVLDMPFDMRHARETTKEVFDAIEDLDAVVCASDVMALAAISTLSELGYKVPDDIAVVGYDDIALAAYGSPAVTTVRQNIRWAGRVLVESVLGLINGEAVSDTLLASELVVRQSSGAGQA